MAPQASAVSALRAITFRISSATKAELPHVVAYVSPSLASCKDLLSEPENLNQKDTDAAIVVNRFNTQIQALLQDRTPEGRWAAVVLVKAAIESGGWETLRRSIGWVRGLLAILKRPDPPITRCLCMIALTRIFMLTWDYPTLIREITTPAVPTFVSTCLNNLATRAYSQDELRTTLETFAHLLPRHPTIFRTNQDAVAKLLQSVLEGSGSSTGPAIRDLARRVSVLLHQCEPKGGAGEKWERSLVATVKATHVVADKTFMSIEEDWQSVAGNHVNKHALSSHYRTSQESKDASDRPVQQFVVSGSDALISNLRLLTSYFSIATPANVVASVGQVTDLLTRLLAVSISTSASKTTVKFNKDSSREERDALTQVLPAIHLAAIQTLAAILKRYGSQLASSVHTFVDQLLWVFNASPSNRGIRTAVYRVMTSLIDLSGPTMTKTTVSSLRKLIVACCEDLLPSQTLDKPDVSANTNGTNNKAPQATMNADSFLKTPTSKTSASSATNASSAIVKQTQFPALHFAAADLLPRLLCKLPSSRIPVALRSLLDRTAVLTRHKSAMTASALNPPGTQTGAKGANSILPLLAREYSDDAAVEALLRPRMPVIETGRRAIAAAGAIDDAMAGEEDENEQSDEDNDDDDDEDEMEVDSAAASNNTTTEASADAAAAAAAAKAQSALSSAINIFTDSAPAVTGTKRPRSPSNAATTTALTTSAPPNGTAVESEKRLKASPADDEVEIPTSVVAGDTVTTLPSAPDISSSSSETRANAVEESDDDDDNFEIPTLVMGADSDDE
ncbi:hypothetical protein AAFC00_003459 [Neodothiora populina]|uniref:Pre-rRNA-processing protein RIX1 n=1 Tax=Neodothiora populina TaxID=2781224 RepID=A0ABR3PFF0_9PEZI